MGITSCQQGIERNQLNKRDTPISDTCSAQVIRREIKREKKKKQEEKKVLDGWGKHEVICDHVYHSFWLFGLRAHDQRVYVPYVVCRAMG